MIFYTNILQFFHFSLVYDGLNENLCHQKKVLALVLAFACAFTMFAGAAFTDQADINADNVDAVDLLTTLKIIKGYEDGSFDPEGTVDRAETVSYTHLDVYKRQTYYCQYVLGDANLVMPLSSAEKICTIIGIGPAAHAAAQVRQA